MGDHIISLSSLAVKPSTMHSSFLFGFLILGFLTTAWSWPRERIDEQHQKRSGACDMTATSECINMGVALEKVRTLETLGEKCTLAKQVVICAVGFEEYIASYADFKQMDTRCGMMSNYYDSGCDMVAANDCISKVDPPQPRTQDGQCTVAKQMVTCSENAGCEDYIATYPRYKDIDTRCAETP